MDSTATQIAQQTGISRQTINKILSEIRSAIVKFNSQTGAFSGEIEVDESYFGPRRVRGKRGRGAGKKLIVFGLLKRIEKGEAKVYAQIIANASRPILKQIISERISENSVVYSDGWRSYDGLVDWGYKRHYRVNHSQNEFVNDANPRNHINGIENFWGVAKVRLAKLRGIRKDKFNLHLQECVFRYNCRHMDIYKTLLDILRKEERAKQIRVKLS